MVHDIPLFLAQVETGGSTPANPPPSMPAAPPPTGDTTASTGGTTTAGTGGAAPPSAGGGLGIMLPVLAVMVLFFIMTSRGSSKEKKKREAMLSSLKKGDKVHTIGGVIGTVIEVRDDEVVLKVDETNNTRIHYVRSAIQSVVPSDKPDVIEKAG